jgi:hypothetical protein
MLLLLHYEEAKHAQIVYEREQGDPAKATAALKSFCGDSVRGDDCWDRYKLHYPLYIAQIRKRMMANDTAHSALLSKQVSKSGVTGDDTPAFEAGRDPNAAPRSPMAAYFPSYDELIRQRSADLQRDAKMQKVVTEGFVNWMKDYPVKPSKDDFVKTKTILRNPDDPTGGHFTVVKTKPDGTAEVDEVAYKLALKAYENSVQSLSDSDKKQMTTDFQKAQTQGRKFQDADKLSMDAFKEARGQLVDSANQVAKTTAGPATPKAKTPGGKFGAAGGVSKSAIDNIAVPTTTPIKGKSASGASSGRTPAQTLPPPPKNGYTGNEEVKPPKGTVENQGNSSTIYMNAESHRKHIIETMRTEVQEDFTPVELPPMDRD